jgi:hypothetical protein
MPDIVESWKWRDPGEIIDRLIGESASDERRAEARAQPKPRVERDGHYTRARQIERKQSLKNVMKGKR